MNKNVCWKHIVGVIVGVLLLVLIVYTAIISAMHFGGADPVPCLDLACECVACINHIPETPAQQ